MFQFDVECPNCKHQNRISLFRFKAKHTCEKCGHTLIVEPRMMITFFVGITLFFFAELLYHVLEAKGFPDYLSFVLILILVYVLYILLIVLLAKLFGVRKIYQVTDYKPNSVH